MPKYVFGDKDWKRGKKQEKKKKVNAPYTTRTHKYILCRRYATKIIVHILGFSTSCLQTKQIVPRPIIRRVLVRRTIFFTSKNSTYKYSITRIDYTQVSTHWTPTLMRKLANRLESQVTSEQITRKFHYLSIFCSVSEK